MYGSWTVTRIKAELSRRGASTSGRKEVLIERLEGYDRNQNFRNEVVLPEFKMPDWPISGFKQLTTEHRILRPKLDRSQVEAYFKFRVAYDNDMVHDLKALEKGEQLMESSRISACSVHLTFNMIHITGIVSAAMKKKVSYNYKACIDGQTAEVINTHCECPAGKGPHGTWKHLAAVLLMLAEFIESEVHVCKTCTESSQTFHIPSKEYNGSPMKAENLPTRKKPCLDDPRPLRYRGRAGFQDDVRNLVINYCWSTGEDLTMRYLYPKVDLTIAQLDHDYLQQPFLEYWVDNIYKLTEAECAELERSTREQSSCRAWHEARQYRLTASRFGEITKITERRNKEKLCKSMTDSKSLTCPSVIHGLKFEAMARKKFQKQTGLIVNKCGLFVRPEYGYLGASPDGVIDDRDIIEIKCPYSGRDEIITPCQHFPLLEYEDGVASLRKDSHYYCQVQGQLFLSKRQCCYFVVYTLKDLYVQKVAVDEEFCRNSLIPKLELFFTKYFRPYLARKLYGKL